MSAAFRAKINARYYKDLDDPGVASNAQEQLDAAEYRRLRLEHERAKLADKKWEESELCDGSDAYKHLSTQRANLQKEVKWMEAGLFRREK